jgi:O-antigen ligase
MVGSTELEPRTGRLEAACEGVIEAGWLACLAVIPLLFDPYSTYSFEPAKSSALRSIALVMAAAWLLKVATGGRPWRPAPADNDRPRRFVLPPVAIPVIAVGLSLLLSTVLSVDPRLSLWGSWTRSQGLITQLCGPVVFGLILAHLRTAAQLRRLTYVVITTSVPVALYAVLQAAGRDPLPWPNPLPRAASTLGNPVFLGAFMVLVLLLTIGELIRRSRKPSPTASPRPLRALIALVAALQLVALALARSRGPVLALVAGAAVMIACFLPDLLARWRQAGRAARWSLVSAAAGLLLALAALALLSVTGPRLPEDDATTVVGRVLEAIRARPDTTTPRLEMWSGAIELASDRPPLRPAHGTPDPLHRLRPLVGHGPEAFPLVFGRFISPQLEDSERDLTAPDRAHNLVLDTLVATGSVGLLAWCALLVSTGFRACGWLGWLDARHRRTSFALAVAGGACVGTLLPLSVSGWSPLAAPGLTAGASLALSGWVAACAVRDRRPIGVRETLILTTLAVVVAHVIEVQFSLRVNATAIVLWTVLAALVAAGLGWLPAGRGHGPHPEAAASRRHQTVVAALLMAPGLLTVVYGFLANWSQHPAAWPILRQTFAGGDERATATCLMLAGSWIGAVLLLPLLAHCPLRRSGLSGRLALLAATLVVPALYAVIKARDLAAIVTARAVTGTPTVTLSEAIARHFQTYSWCLLAVVVAGGVAIGAPRDLWRPTSWRRLTVVGVCALALGVTCIAAITVVNLNPIRAATLLKHGRALSRAERPLQGLEVLERAAQIAPREPSIRLAMGSVLMEASRREGARARREMLLQRAEHALVDARRLAPYHPDHTANVARCLVVQAATVDDPRAVEELRLRAEVEYEEALRLRPTWLKVQQEYALLLDAMGRRDEARRLRQTGRVTP